jgi:hypothetical protein
MEFWFTEDGMYALKKVLIQSDEQLEFVNKEIEVSSLFDHPILEHSIISVKVRQCYPTIWFASGELSAILLFWR